MLLRLKVTKTKLEIVFDSRSQGEKPYRNVRIDQTKSYVKVQWKPCWTVESFSKSFASFSKSAHTFSKTAHTGSGT
jgi:retron-type reverse transcriptase